MKGWNAPAPNVSETRLVLERAQLAGDATGSWLENRPDVTGDYKRDAAAFSRQWQTGARLLSRLPAKPRRNEAEAAAAGLIIRIDREARDRFLAAHAEQVYRLLTKDYANFLRVERLVYDAAALVPGLTPTHEAVAAEREVLQRDKDGVEIDQGVFLSRILASRRAV